MAGTVLDHFRGHLIDLGIVRKPNDGSSPALHPMYAEPRTGTPAPGDLGGVETDKVMVLGCQRATPIGIGPYESWYWKPTVEVIYRAKNARDVDALEAQIRGEFEDRRAWVTLTGLQVIESGVWRETARIGSDERAFTFMTSFWLQLYSGRAPRN